MRARVKLILLALFTVPLLSTLSCTTAGTTDAVDGGSPSDRHFQPAGSTEKMLTKISTKIDPAFSYEYEQSKFVPPDGRTLLIMGQDLNTIADYVASFPDRPVPGGWSAYWGITSMKGVDRMNADDIAREYGRQNHQKLVDRYPNTVLQSGL